MTEVLGFYPTWLSLDARRLYAGREYSRKSRTFGKREPIVLVAQLTTAFVWPYLPGATVKFYLNGKYIGEAKTDWFGEARVLLETGLPVGSHKVEAVYEGDAWFAGSRASIDVTSVDMELAHFKVYVESIARASPSQVESSIVDDLLNKEIGVVPYKTEADFERIRYLISMYVPVQSTSQEIRGLPLWAIIAIVLGSIATVFASVAVLIQVIVVYVVGQYQCGVCGARFTTCEALREHLVSAHPDVWEKVKDRFECKPPEGDLLKWIVYGVAITGGLVLAITIAKAVRG